jgi:hypothetical protein
MTTDNATANELSDIKTQFYAIVENYPAIYANYKANPNLPSAMTDHDKLESKLTSLYRRMFIFQAAVEKELEHHENALNQLTDVNLKLNATLAKTTASMQGKNAMIVKNDTLKNSVTVSGLGDDLPVQISIVEEAKSIEKTAYIYSIARIVYLLVGIAIVSYFILKTVAGPDSTILSDAKMKAEQLRNTMAQQATPNPPTQPAL